MSKTTKTKAKVINFATIDTVDRKDDGAWNAMEFFGTTDGKEAAYKSPKKVAPEVAKKLKARKLNFVLNALRTA